MQGVWTDFVAFVARQQTVSVQALELCNYGTRRCRHDTSDVTAGTPQPFHVTFVYHGSASLIA